MEQDPIGFMGADSNLYRYGDNNPVNKIDPLGFRTYSLGISFGAQLFGPWFNVSFDLLHVGIGNDAGLTFGSGITVAGGLGFGVGISGGPTITTTSADNVSQLRGPAACVHGQFIYAGGGASFGSQYTGVTTDWPGLRPHFGVEAGGQYSIVIDWGEVWAFLNNRPYIKLPPGFQEPPTWAAVGCP
jgi:uncharacterized protein RhaS with RHS repeats